MKQTHQETLRLAMIRKSREMWQWLADNPTLGKRDYFDAHRTTADHQPIFGCFCCEFVHRITGETPGCVRGSNKEHLRLCPLQSVWPGGCQGDKSPYRKWSYAERLYRRGKTAAPIKKAALEIVAACDRLLAEAKKEKKP